MSETGLEQAEESRSLAGKLAGYAGPAYRKAYLSALLASAERFLAAGNSAGADYCLAKVAAEILAASESPERNRKREGGSETILPAERLRGQWRLDRIRGAEHVLARHGDRLSALEKRTFREKLGKLLRATLGPDYATEYDSDGGGAEQAPPENLGADKADSMLLDLRRRLYGRVLSARKVALKRKRMPVSLARIAIVPPLAGTQGESALAVIPGAASAPAMPAIGPYNDRYNMEDLLSLVAGADPTWVEEFLELYRGLGDIRGLMAAVPPAKK